MSKTLTLLIHLTCFLFFYCCEQHAKTCGGWQACLPPIPKLKASYETWRWRRHWVKSLSRWFDVTVSLFLSDVLSQTSFVSINQSLARLGRSCVRKRNWNWRSCVTLQAVINSLATQQLLTIHFECILLAFLLIVFPLVDVWYYGKIYRLCTWR